MEGHQALDTLLSALNADDDKQFKLAVLEAIGTLALMVHHLRGRMSWLTYTGAVQFPNLSQQQEYDRMNDLIAQLEPILWAIAPPRAMLIELAKFRETGILDEGFASLLARDDVGRIPEDGKPVNDTQMEEVLNRLKDYRTYRTVQGS